MQSGQVQSQKGMCWVGRSGTVVKTNYINQSDWLHLEMAELSERQCLLVYFQSGCSKNVCNQLAILRKYQTAKEKIVWKE